MPIWRNRRGPPGSPPRPRLIDWLGRLVLAIQDLCFGDLRPTRRVVPDSPDSLDGRESKPAADPAPAIGLYQAPDWEVRPGGGEVAEGPAPVWPPAAKA